MTKQKLNIPFLKIGLGCMPFSGCYAQINESEAVKIITKHQVLASIILIQQITTAIMPMKLLWVKQLKLSKIKSLSAQKSV